MIYLPRNSTLFPYTTLFRSVLDLQMAHFLEHGQRRIDRAWAGRVLAVEHLLDDADELVAVARLLLDQGQQDRKSTRLNSSHVESSYAVFCLKKKNPDYK